MTEDWEVKLISDSFELEVAKMNTIATLDFLLFFF